MSWFDSVLVANRGEIASRIMRTASALGLRTIAVYSEADAGAPHVAQADDAFLLGPAPVGESYLRIDRILEAAAATGAQAVHPGYGFLSENADFARAVEAAGLVFIGPRPDAIALMGNKGAARRRMLEAGVPCVPGYEGPGQSDAAFVTAAASLGYPVMVKAAAGGGGRGMRLVHDAEALPAALRTARSEAKSAFGSEELILERAILRPRHVEIQVFADEQGNTVYLGERDCSVQRRHQKVVEEAPCPVMTPELRERMGRSAVEAARSIGYRGAGTVEFLLDEVGHFYFLEMNTRLQVEHPVTECTTGLDLVALQISIATGQPLGFTQADVALRGHAIEARLYAEDPANDFLPVTGRISCWRPATGEGIRIDAGICSGQAVTPFYDPMLAKVIAWGSTRDEAIHRLVDALERTHLLGLATNRQFLVDVLRRPAFGRGEATTAFIAEEFHGRPATAVPGVGEVATAAVLQFLAVRDAALARSLAPRGELLDWSSRGSSYWHARYRCGESPVEVVVAPAGGGRYAVTVDGEAVQVEVLERKEHEATLAIDGRRCSVGCVVESGGSVHLASGSRTLVFGNEFAGPVGEEGRAAGGRTTALMHGVLVEVCVQAGERVEKGARLGLLEAMKMQHEVRAGVAGTVANVAARAGDQVAAGDLLFEIEVAPGADPAG